MDRRIKLGNRAKSGNQTESCKFTRREFIAGSAILGASLAAPSLVPLQAFADTDRTIHDGSRAVIDSLGRVVNIPQKVERVVLARPNGQAFVSALCPNRLVALAYEPSGLEKNVTYNSDLTVPGQFFHLSSDETIAIIKEVRPDIILDVGMFNRNLFEYIERVESLTGIPLVSIELELNSIGEAFRALDVIFDTTRGEELATYVETSTEEIKELASQIDPEGKPKVLFCGEGLSIRYGQGQRLVQQEMIAAAGGIDTSPSEKGESTAALIASPSSLAPEVLIVPDRQSVDIFYDTSDLRSLSWADIPAVQNERIHVFPLDKGGKEGVPVLERYVLGTHFLASVLHPDKYHFSFEQVKADFVERFYLQAIA